MFPLYVFGWNFRFYGNDLSCAWIISLLNRAGLQQRQRFALKSIVVKARIWKGFMQHHKMRTWGFYDVLIFECYNPDDIKKNRILLRWIEMFIFSNRSKVGFLGCYTQWPMSLNLSCSHVAAKCIFWNSRLGNPFLSSTEILVGFGECQSAISSCPFFTFLT